MIKLHEIENVGDKHRRMLVESGWLYSSWDYEQDNWDKKWTFVPHSAEYIKKLQHHHDTTVGLWATDVPDKIKDKEAFDKLAFRITSPFDDLVV